MKKILLIAAFSIALLSCSSQVDLAIDNPTMNPVIVKIDTLAVEIPAREVVWVEMGKGKHTVTTEDNNTVEYDFQKSLYMINPTLSQYLEYQEIYGRPSPFDQQINSNSEQTVNFLGMEMTGNYKVYDKLITPVTWDCGPREALPETIEIEEGESSVVLTKLLDPIEFIELVQAADSESNAE
ncbi:hypothetical protein GCM10011506_09820 [Marivirga lumbricoides]|uniref:DUF4412 domain-containing protein n=1 Tax=Marivirga lumbricoides TaxID=1046115 RepID=A0A2T4DR21_9BACT|nr:hypothetical protein C9994_08140 [Marivirga lumbricoides]GGC26442.1 hypothetical protein GCM10011506_09820 [Marivirga lumbricoides]